MPRVAVIVCLLVSAAVGRADGPAARDITVDDYFTLAAVTEVRVSPDGTLAAYADARWRQSTNDRKADLWVVPTAGGPARRLTSDRCNPHTLRWAADGKAVYFAAGRKRPGETQPPFDGKPQVWRVGLDGGEPTAVTQVDGGVQQYDLTADGKTLFYTTAADADDGEWAGLRQKYAGLEYGHGSRRVTRVWRLDLPSWRADKVLDAGRYVHDFAASPDGQRLALITAPDDRVISFEGKSRVDVCNVAEKTVKPLTDRLWRADAPSPYGWLETLAWSSDGKWLAFEVIFDAYPAEIIVAEFGADGPRMYRLKRPAGVSVKGYGSPLQWRDPATLCWLAESRCQVRLVATPFGNGQGEHEFVTASDAVVSAFSLGRNAKSPGVVLRGDAATLPELYNVAGTKLTDLNPQAAAWKRPTVSVVSWKGANGDDVHGVLELPAGHQKGQRLPLVVGIHGGPTTAVYASQEFNYYEARTYFPARGYAVLLPNYRGSTGNGDRFLTDLVGRENDVDVEDILKGVDAMVERGVADPERLGVTGWSNGGYLTNCLITKTTRFKAASSGAGILDTVMEWGANDEPAYPTVFKRGFPWQTPDVYHKTSPTYALDKVKTPTLIHVGGNDERCPPVHSRMLYRALREYGGVPTQLLVYPGEPHGLTKYTNRKAKMEWDLAWFDRYVLGRGGK